MLEQCSLPKSSMSAWTIILWVTSMNTWNYMIHLSPIVTNASDYATKQFHNWIDDNKKEATKQFLHFEWYNL